VAGIVKYIEESFSELVHKVTWPKWEELQSSSILVLVASLIFALIIFVMDFVCGINVKFDGQGQAIHTLWDGVLGLYYGFVGAY